VWKKRKKKHECPNDTCREAYGEDTLRWKGRRGGRRSVRLSCQLTVTFFVLGDVVRYLSAESENVANEKCSRDAEKRNLSKFEMDGGSQRWIPLFLRHPIVRPLVVGRTLERVVWVFRVSERWQVRRDRQFGRCHRDDEPQCRTARSHCAALGCADPRPSQKRTRAQRRGYPKTTQTKASDGSLVGCGRHRH
jgi:hypothetical protein